MIHSVTYAKQKENQQVINFIEINRLKNIFFNQIKNSIYIIHEKQNKL
jgi:hypothetical protein